jgi:hypothetical protein
LRFSWLFAVEIAIGVLRNGRVLELLALVAADAIDWSNSGAHDS